MALDPRTTAVRPPVYWSALMSRPRVLDHCVAAVRVETDRLAARFSEARHAALTYGCAKFSAPVSVSGVVRRFAS